MNYELEQAWNDLPDYIKAHPEVKRLYRAADTKAADESQQEPAPGRDPVLVRYAGNGKYVPARGVDVPLTAEPVAYRWRWHWPNAPTKYSDWKLIFDPSEVDAMARNSGHFQIEPLSPCGVQGTFNDEEKKHG